MRFVFPGLCSLLAMFFAWLFHARYWTYRDCIDAAKSSCVLPDGNNLTSGGMIWGGFALLLALAALVTWWSSLRR
jgi:cell division protein FtsX